MHVTDVSSSSLWGSQFPNATGQLSRGIDGGRGWRTTNCFCQWDGEGNIVLWIRVPATDILPWGRRLNDYLGLSLNDRTILFILILVGYDGLCIRTLAFGHVSCSHELSRSVSHMSNLWPCVLVLSSFEVRRKGRLMNISHLNFTLGEEGCIRVLAHGEPVCLAEYKSQEKKGTGSKFTEDE